MTFMEHYAETLYPLFLKQMKEEGVSHSWNCDIQVTKRWFYSVNYQTNRRHHVLTFSYESHYNKSFAYIRLIDGIVVESQNPSLFKYLFLALSSSVIEELYDRKTYKISKIKLEERFIPASPYRWNKIEYYLQKKYDQQELFQLFGDERYKRREEWLHKGIQSYMKQIKTTLV